MKYTRGTLKEVYQESITIKKTIISNKSITKNVNKIVTNKMNKNDGESYLMKEFSNLNYKFNSSFITKVSLEKEHYFSDFSEDNSDEIYDNNENHKTLEDKVILIVEKIYMKNFVGKKLKVYIII